MSVGNISRRRGSFIMSVSSIVLSSQLINVQILNRHFKDFTTNCWAASSIACDSSQVTDLYIVQNYAAQDAHLENEPTLKWAMYDCANFGLSLPI